MTEHPMQPKGTAESETPLESWKEISAYLQRDVSTVKRWERHESLPVHRHLHQARSSVYAYPSELDAWWAQRRPAKEAAALGWLERGPVRAVAFAAMLLLTLTLAGGGMVLSPLTSAAQGPAIVVKRIWSGPDVDPMGAPSPDGRYLTYVHWDTGDLAVRDLHTQENRMLTNKGTWADSDEYAEFSIFSPDGTQVAYAWFNGEFYDLRTIRLEGSGQRVVYSNREEVKYLQPAAWTPDGKYILAVFSCPDGTNQMVRVSVADGSVRVLKSFDWRWPRLDLSPGGRYIAYDFPPREDASQRDIFLLTADGVLETPLVENPAHDRLLGWTSAGDRILFATDRTGAISAWSLRVTKGKPEGEPQLVRSSLGRVSPLGFDRAGVFYYGMGGLRDVRVAEVDLSRGVTLKPAENVTHRYQGTNYAPAWSPDGNSLAYFSRRGSQSGGLGAISLIIKNVPTEEERELVPKLSLARGGPRTRISWYPDGSAVVVLAQDEKGRSGAYRVDVRTGKAELLLRLESTVEEHIPFVELLPDGKRLLIKRVFGPPKFPRLTLYNLETGLETVLHRARHIHAWALSPDGGYLACATVTEEDAEAAKPPSPMSNRLRVMNLADGQWREVFSVPPERKILAVVWTPDQRYLLFKLGTGDDEDSQVWRIPVEGGKPEPTQLSLSPGNLQETRFHPSGKRVAFTVPSPESNEIWVMENFLPALKAEK